MLPLNPMRGELAFELSELPHPAGQLAQRAVGRIDAAGRQERAELPQVAGHCCVGAIPGSVGALARVLRSDCHNEPVEDRAKPVAGGDVEGDVVVAAAQVLHEGMTSGQDPR